MLSRNRYIKNVFFVPISLSMILIMQSCTRLYLGSDNQEIFDCGHIIVYGTLKRNNARQDIMPGEFLAEGIIIGELYDLGSYPGLTHGDKKIHC